MSEEGPDLARLLRRLTDCPPEFLLPVKTAVAPDGIHIDALISDLMRAMDVIVPQAVLYELEAESNDEGINRAQLQSLAVWLFYDEWFLSNKQHAVSIFQLFKNEIPALADVLDHKQFLKDPDRREELARMCLAGIGLRPAGESEAQAQDRLNTLDSAKRIKLLKETRAAEERARKVRERLAAEAAKAAASRYTSE